MRDITLEDTFIHAFTTRAFATGVPTTLAGTPSLAVLEGGNATPITAGVSLSVDRASVTGLHEATIVATAANGYEAGKSYSIYIAAGTVDSVSVIGEVVGSFTVGASAAAGLLAGGVTLADGAHGGSSTVLTMDHVIINSATDHGIDIQVGTAANKHGININASTSTAIGLKVHGDLSGAVFSNTSGSAGHGISATSNGTGAGLDLFSTSGKALDTGTTSGGHLSTGSLAEINAEVDTAIAAAPPPTTAQIADAIFEEQPINRTTPATFGLLWSTTDSNVSENAAVLADIQGLSFDTNTDSLEAIRNSVTTAQTDLDTLTGSDGVTLATSQPNYAPATAASLAAAQTDLDTLTDPLTLPGQETPDSTPTLNYALAMIYKIAVNKKTGDGSTEQLYNSAGTVVDQKQTVSEAAGTVTKAGWVTGP